MKASKIISLNFFDDLSSTFVARSFLFIFAVLVCLTLFAAFALNKYPAPSFWTETTTQLLIEICSGSIIILSVYFLYLLFIGPNTETSQVSATRPQDISEKIEELPQDTRNYMFWGRSGSYFRAHPLRTMDEQARQSRRNINVIVLLPDPNDARLTESYRKILESLGENEGDDPLLPHVLATCVACSIVSAKNRHLDVQVFLSSFIPGFRLDLSDNGAMLTQDDRNKSALHFTANSEFYEMWRSTMLDECKISCLVQLNNYDFRSLSLHTSEYPPDALNSFGIHISDSEKLRKRVASLVRDKLHRYK